MRQGLISLVDQKSVMKKKMLIFCNIRLCNWKANSFVIALRFSRFNEWIYVVDKKADTSIYQHQNKQTEHEIQLFLLATSGKQEKKII